MVGGTRLFRGLGILLLSVLILFVAVFFYFYLTGGGFGVLHLLGGEGVGVLLVEGTINDSREAIGSLKQFGKSSQIKAVVVRIDSPGGGVVPTQEIYDEIGKLKEKKPVIASLGGMATSGGYYIASACSTIMSNPGTLTGSIGVIMELPNVEGLMKMLGLEETNIKSGPHKDLASPLRPLSPKARVILQSVVDNVHGQFVRAVARGRKMEEARVRELADGRIYSGEQAKEVGLVDTLGNIEDAIDLAARRAGIEGRPQVVYAQAHQGRWWERLLFSIFRGEWRGSERWGLRFQ